MGAGSSLLRFLGVGAPRVNVLVVGLDASGKSTAVERLKAPQVVPTVGFNVEEFAHGGLSFTAFDMGGAGRYRALWAQYFREAQAVVFVVDAADRLRLVVAKDELDALVAHPSLGRRVPLLLLANKSDLPSALSAVELAQALKLDDVVERPWQIVATNALTGEGLAAGFDWLAGKLLARMAAATT